MNYFCLSLFLCCLHFFLVSVSAKTENELIQEYLRKLEDSGYDKRVAPEGRNGPNSPLDVNCTMYVLDISKVDDNEMSFDAQFYFRQSWTDPRLAFSDKISRIILTDVDKIWTPDLFFVNEKEGTLHKIIQTNMFLRISSNGSVLFSVRLSETLTCIMDLRKFPLDTQICPIRIESYGFDRKTIDLRWSNSVPKAVDAERNITETDFNLIDIESTSSYESFTFGNYSRLEVSITLKRKAGLFVKTLYAPFIFLVLLSSLSFWMAAKERYLRLALLLVILYLMVTISTELNHKIPEVPYTKASDEWIVFCEALVFAAFLEFIAVCILTGRESSQVSSTGAMEIELSLDPEAKDQNKSTDSLKSPLNKVMKMFDARRGASGRNNLSYTIDKISRILFPVIFVLFNIVYWSVFSS